MADSVLSMVVTPIITHKSKHDVTSKGKHYSFKIGPCCSEGVHLFYTLQVDQPQHPLAILTGQATEEGKKVAITVIESNVHPFWWWRKLKIPVPFFKWRVRREIALMKKAFVKAELLEKRVNALREELEQDGIQQQSL